MMSPHIAAAPGRGWRAASLTAVLVCAALPPAVAAAPLTLPPGATALAFDDLEGVLMLRASLRERSGADTSGWLVLDTGAPGLALDRRVALRLGVTDSLGPPSAIGVAPRPIDRLELGPIQIDQVSPVLTIDAEVVRRVTDRGVLGLLGERALAPYAIWVDLDRDTLVLVPVGPARAGEDARAASRRSLPMLSPRARAVPLRIAGDDKLLVEARAGDARGRPTGKPLTLALDTGATKTILFEPALSRRVPASGRWPALRGLAAPTLLGSDAARMVRVPSLSVGAGAGRVSVSQSDAAAMASPLAAALSSAAGQPVHGLLGYSFLRRHRFAIDVPRRLLWLDPRVTTRDVRSTEYVHVGVQVERDGDALRVVAVARGSPAARAGIRVGDRLESIDHRRVAGDDLLTVARRLEGAPGSRVTLAVRHGGARRTLTLVRRRLL